MSTLFKDAIADAKQLRLAAETNAKNKILESITPRIRALIEQELMVDEEEADAATSDLGAILGSMDDEVSASEQTESEARHTHISVSADGDIEVDIGSSEEEVDDEGWEEQSDSMDNEEPLATLNAESARALSRLIKNPAILSEVGLQSRINNLSIKVKRFSRLLEWANIDEGDVTLRESARKNYTQLLKEAISLRDHVIFTKRAQNKKEIRSGFNEIIKEIRKMSRRHAESLFDKLFENRRRSLSELDVVLSDEDFEALGVEDTEEVNVDDLEAVVSMSGEEEVEEESTEEEAPIDLGELDLVLSDDDLDVLGVEEPEEVDVDAFDVSVELGAEDDVDVEEETEEESFEIDEAVLRRELRRMRRLREQEEAKDADPYLDHGGEEVGDLVLDIDEDDLINALADELGDPGVPEPTVESRRRRARRRRVSETRSRRRNTARAPRAGNKKLVEYKKAVVALKGQLTEMNLFNAKLLYVNKLMQNRNLTTKQQRAIVEALDNAKTLREAKLLYKSLTTSLKKRGTLREGRRTLGSSSRSTRQAQPAKKSGEVDRWAVLAGIDNKN